MYDKIEDTIFLFSQNLKANLTISYKDDSEKYPSIDTYEFRGNNGKSKRGLKLNLSAGLSLDYSKFNQETRLTERNSVFITEVCWYNFISGLVDSVRLFDKIVIYHDNEPDIDNSVKTKWIKIKNLSQGKSLIIAPCVHENIYPKDDLKDTPTYYPGFEMYINSNNHFVFVEEDKFKSFVYKMEKFDLIGSSRLLFNNALLIDQLGV